MKKESKMLAVLLALLLVLFLNNLRKAEIKRVDELTYKTAQRQVSAPAVESGLPEIETDLLTPERESFRMGKKNIFEPLSFVKKRRPRKPATPKAAPPKPAPPKPAVKQVPPPMHEVVLKAIAKYTFLGLMEKGDLKTIFLTKEDEIFNVKKGDPLSGDYVVQNITDDFIEISSNDGSGTMTISLVENAALTEKR